MSAPDTCGQRNPSVAGPRCTRPAGHAGGHRDSARDIYWQAAPAPAEPDGGQP